MEEDDDFTDFDDVADEDLIVALDAATASTVSSGASTGNSFANTSSGRGATANPISLLHPPKGFGKPSSVQTKNLVTNP